MNRLLPIRLLYGIAAACFIGVGSGLAAFYSDSLERESQMILAIYEVEQMTKLYDFELIKCTDYPDAYADCKHAQYLIEANTISARFLSRLAWFLVILGLVAGAWGATLHYENSKGCTSAQ